MKESKLSEFTKETIVTYRGDDYLVRDNGAVNRLTRAHARKRPLDDVWTFGAINVHSGYRRLCTTAVHRIVTTAFHGEQPSPEHVVDHIDTNRLNNRPANLRWVTRLENIQDNPKTRQFIENKWGSIEGLLNDPNRSEIAAPITNRPWLREALVDDAMSDDSTVESLTPLARQRNWRTPSEFPMCPNQISDHPLHDYAARLWCGAVLARNKYGRSEVELAELSKGGQTLSVICLTGGGVKDYAVAKITIEGGNFIHASVGTYFDYYGAAKSHCETIGAAWEKPDGYDGCIDNYC